MDTPIKQLSIQGFLDELAAGTPTPGGGSVAALSGAMGIGLVSMVAALSLQKVPAEQEASLRDLHRQSEELRAQLLELAQEDIAVFNRVSAAYKLSRTTAADAASRKAAIQKTTRQAAEVALRTARTAAAIFPPCHDVLNYCSRMIVSDVGVAALLGRTCLESSLMNVEVNLVILDDPRFVREMRAHLDDLRASLETQVTEIVTEVRKRINNE